MVEDEGVYIQVPDRGYPYFVELNIPGQPSNQGSHGVLQLSQSNGTSPGPRLSSLDTNDSMSFDCEYQ